MKTKALLQVQLQRLFTHLVDPSGRHVVRNEHVVLFFYDRFEHVTVSSVPAAGAESDTPVTASAPAATDNPFDQPFAQWVTTFPHQLQQRVLDQYAAPAAAGSSNRQPVGQTDTDRLQSALEIIADLER
jgi:hypothetical protein